MRRDRLVSSLAITYVCFGSYYVAITSSHMRLHFGHACQKSSSSWIQSMFGDAQFSGSLPRHFATIAERRRATSVDDLVTQLQYATWLAPLDPEFATRLAATVATYQGTIQHFRGDSVRRAKSWMRPVWHSRQKVRNVALRSRGTLVKWTHLCHFGGCRCSMSESSEHMASQPDGRKENCSGMLS